jgi:hypothetical protein
MRKTSKVLFLLLLICTLLFIVTACQDNKQQVIKSEEIPEYVLTKEIGKDGDGEVYRISEYSYDEWGNVVKIEHKNGQGEVIENKEYQYNEQGLKVKRKIIKVVKSTGDYRWRSGTYDREELDEKRKVRETLYLTKGETTYHYNNDNQLVYYEKINESGKKINWIDFEYHDNGNLKFKHFQTNRGSAKKNYYNKDRKLVKQIDFGPYFGDEKIEKFFYDEEGNRIKIITKTIDKSGDIIDLYSSKYKYDKQGNKEKLEFYEEGKYDGGHNYKYDDKGNKIENVKLNKNGEIEWVEKYKYDDKGDRSYYLKKTGEGEIIFESRYNYEYDKNGNLIKDDFAEYEYKKLK